MVFPIADSDDMQEKIKLHNKEVGRRVAKARLRKGWKQTDLAAKSKLPQSTISAIETGARGANHVQLQALAKALAVPILGLWASQETGSPPTGWYGGEELHNTNNISFRNSEMSGDDKGEGGDWKYIEYALNFLRRNRTRLQITAREANYILSSRFRLESWVTFDEDFFGRLLNFWRDYLASVDKKLVEVESLWKPPEGEGSPEDPTPKSASGDVPKPDPSKDI